MTNASFGLEHMLREIGQVYEAVEQSQFKEGLIKFKDLPQISADLLIEGYPLELMDGDATFCTCVVIG